MTQETVAAHLGVSFQSVSKWERGDGYPDITMLPSLASYFGVSVDELIGIEEIAKSEKYEEINRLWRENNAAGLHRNNLAHDDGTDLEAFGGGEESLFRILVYCYVALWPAMLYHTT